MTKYARDTYKSLDEEILNLFFYWINERHAIYLERNAGEEWPWTDDKILQEYKFTNAFRELDVGTVWLRKNIREPYAQHPLLFFNICFYRQFNWIGTAERIGFIDVWDPNHYEDILREMKANNEKIFTGAHMITGTVTGRTSKIDKITQHIHHIFTPIWNDMEDYMPDGTLESSFLRLLAAPGFGPFISYEVITDLRWTRYLDKAHDIMTWANPGPGAMRGINRILGIPTGRRNEAQGKKDHYPVEVFPTKDYVFYMQDLLDMSDSYILEHVPSLEMRDIEHSLCEFDKYMRLKLGQGTVRGKFTPPHKR